MEALDSGLCILPRITLTTNEEASWFCIQVANQNFLKRNVGQPFFFGEVFGWGAQPVRASARKRHNYRDRVLRTGQSFELISLDSLVYVLNLPSLTRERTAIE
jgi:hypothetical protein